jgi:enamine deaminase RidA (YjgF/YER057c/UK114 family)
MPVTPKPAVKPLLPVTFSQGNIRYAPGVRAGRWVFATGHKAVRNFAGPVTPEVVRSDLPGWDRPKLQREAAQIFRNVETVMKAGGSELRNVVRVDQNYTVPRAVELYHDVRRAVMKDHIPPSTSTLAEGLLLKDQQIEVHMLGIVPGPGFRPVHIRPKDQEVHASSGYSLALAAGDFVFIAGRMADGLRFGEGLAAEARMPEGHLWKGMPIRLEAEVIMKRKIEPALKAAGSSLANVVKLQVYMRDVNDFAPLNQVLAKYFPRAKPAITLIPTATPGFFLSDARIEINAIALRDGGRTRKRVIDAGVVPAYGGYSQAVRAGDLLFISGMLAIDRNGLVPSARPDPAQPHFGSSIRAQMEHLLENAEKLCRKAGTSLANVVRVQQYHTDLNEFQGAYDVWAGRLPGQHLPFSAVKVPFLPVPGCTVQLDLWVYVP